MDERLLSEPSPIIPLESDMKKQEHLWQNHSPNFLAEKAFNAAVSALEPYCAICSLFHPYAQVGLNQSNLLARSHCLEQFPSTT